MTSYTLNSLNLISRLYLAGYFLLTQTSHNGIMPGKDL